jgi:hypothetical protein
VIKAFIICIIATSMLEARPENAADQALDDARSYADSGDYAKALERHEWYHKNALAIEPALYGVRLSFALSDWRELAAKYPPALEALKRTRDEGTKTLESGTGSPELFHDVESINEHLKEPSATIALFKALHASRPKLAKECFRFADKALINAKEFGLFLQYVHDLQTYLKRQIELHDMTTSYLKSKGTSTASSVEQLDQELVELTLTLAKLATEKGEFVLASELKSMTLQSVADPRLGR